MRTASSSINTGSIGSLMTPPFSGAIQSFQPRSSPRLQQFPKHFCVVPAVACSPVGYIQSLRNREHEAALSDAASPAIGLRAIEFQSGKVGKHAGQEAGE